MARKLNSNEIASLFWRSAEQRGGLAWYSFPGERMTGFGLTAKQAAWLFDVLCREHGRSMRHGDGSLLEDGQIVGRWEAHLSPNGAANFKAFFSN